MNGGYLMISKNDSDIYTKAQKALVLGKPILFYENSTTCYYIDTISGGEITTEIVDDEEVTSYGDIILTKGGKTITITSANAVSESGNIQQTTENFDALMENIVDSAGNKRFIEGSGDLQEVEGITFTYNKWSLSGSHLMITLAGTVVNGTTVAHDTIFADFTLPEFIFNKIVAIFGTVVSVLSTNAYDTTGASQQFVNRLIKTSDKLRLGKLNNITLTADRNFRIQYDLLIDADYSE